jgi:hypothetical protein
MWGFARSTIASVMNHEHCCSVILNSLLRRPEVIEALGPSNLLALIEHAVGQLQYFIQSKPDHDPFLNPTSSWKETEDGEFDFDHLEKTHGEPGYTANCSSTLISLGRLLSLMEPEVLPL